MTLQNVSILFIYGVNGELRRANDVVKCTQCQRKNAQKHL